MLNSIQVVARLTRDPEVREVNTTFLSKLGLCITSEIRTKEGFKEEVCFIDATVWGKKAEFSRNLKKGSQVFISGRLKLDKWEDKETKQPKEKLVIHVDDFIHQYELDKNIVLETSSGQAYNSPQNKSPNDPFVRSNAPAGRSFKSAPVSNESYDQDNLPF